MMPMENESARDDADTPFDDEDLGEELSGFLWVSGGRRRFLAQDPTGGYIEVDLVDYDEVPMMIHLLSALASGVNTDGLYIVEVSCSQDGLSHNLRIDPCDLDDALRDLNETLAFCKRTLQTHETMRSRLMSLFDLEQN